MTIEYTFNDDNSEIRVRDFNGDELNPSPVTNPDAPQVSKDAQGIPIEPDLRSVCQSHLDGSYQPSAYTQQFLAEITLGDVAEVDSF